SGAAGGNAIPVAGNRDWSRGVIRDERRGVSRLVSNHRRWWDASMGSGGGALRDGYRFRRPPVGHYLCLPAGRGREVSSRTTEPPGSRQVLLVGIVVLNSIRSTTFVEELRAYGRVDPALLELVSPWVLDH